MRHGMTSTYAVQIRRAAAYERCGCPQVRTVSKTPGRVLAGAGP